MPTHRICRAVNADLSACRATSQRWLARRSKPIMRWVQRWPVVSCTNISSRSKCALHRACTQSSSQYGFQQSCTRTAMLLRKMPCASMAGMQRLACTPYQVSVSLATVCSQCRRAATRRPDSSACATGTAPRPALARCAQPPGAAADWLH